MDLSSLGWNDALAASFEPHRLVGLLPARVALEHKHAFELLSSAGDLTATCTGHMLHAALTRADLPAVGDWVAVRMRPGELRADIHAVLPRRTKFSRRAAGEDREQIVAANVDTVLLVTALDQNFNLRRIERYLAAAWESGAQPVVVLNKCDLHPDPAAARAEVESVALGAPVIVLSALGGGFPSAPTMDQSDTPETLLAAWLRPGQTIALLGSSGVGKSTLVNRLLGTERQATLAVSSAVNKGRHTTTRRELLLTPSGALVMDTPGMRELQLWDVEERALETTFADITALAARCRFNDCAHQREPGCAVNAALDDGTLPVERWASYQKLQREQAYLARKEDRALARESKAIRKKISQAQRAQYRMRDE